MRVGGNTWDVEVTGADRVLLSCPMLLGKELLDRIHNKEQLALI
jgi:hypothetical protein